MGQEDLGRVQKDLGYHSQGVIRGLDERNITLDGSAESKEQKKAVKRDWL